MEKKTRIILKFVTSSIMAILGIIAIWYLEDIRFKLFGAVMLCWEGFYWYSDDYRLFYELKEVKQEAMQSEARYSSQA